MNGPKYKRAYEPWSRAPTDVPAELQLLWYQTALGVLLLNTTPEAREEAARQADMTLKRLSERESYRLPSMFHGR